MIDLLLLCDPLSPAPVWAAVPCPERHWETSRGVSLRCLTEQLHQGFGMLEAVKKGHAGSVGAGKLTRVLSAAVKGFTHTTQRPEIKKLGDVLQRYPIEPSRRDTP